MTRKILSAIQVVEADDLKVEFVPCPEWAPKFQEDGTTLTTDEERQEFGLIMRSLTGLERGRFIQRSLAAKALAEKAGSSAAEVDADLETQLVVTCAVDEEGASVFSAEAAAALAKSDPANYGWVKTAADLVKVMRHKNANPIGRCSGVAQKMSGLTADVQKAAVKTSETTQNDASSSGSVSP